MLNEPTEQATTSSQNTTEELSETKDIKPIVTTSTTTPTLTPGTQQKRPYQKTVFNSSSNVGRKPKDIAASIEV